MGKSGSHSGVFLYPNELSRDEEKNEPYVSHMQSEACFDGELPPI